MEPIGKFFYSISFFFAVFFGLYDIEPVAFEKLKLFKSANFVCIEYEAKGMWNERCEKLADAGQEIEFRIYISLIALKSKKIIVRHNSKIIVSPKLAEKNYKILFTDTGKAEIVKTHFDLRRKIETGAIMKVHEYSKLKNDERYSYFIEIKPHFESEYLEEQNLTPQALWNNQKLAHTFKTYSKERLDSIFGVSK